MLELMQESPLLFFFYIIFSISITLLFYGAFPMLFAIFRKSPITKKKYRGLCFGVNVAPMILFMILSARVSTGGPYFLWTMVFSAWGAKILKSKGLLETYTSRPANRPAIPKAAVADGFQICFCRKCGGKLEVGSSTCHKCGTEIIEI